MCARVCAYTCLSVSTLRMPVCGVYVYVRACVYVNVCVRDADYV